MSARLDWFRWGLSLYATVVALVMVYGVWRAASDGRWCVALIVLWGAGWWLKQSYDGWRTKP